MPVPVLMPKLGLTMTEAKIVEWKKKDGDTISQGDILFVLETEKVTYEVEAPQNGLLGKILVQEQETVPVGTIVAYLLEEGESMDEVELETPPAPEAVEPKPSPAPPAAEGPSPVPQMESPAGGRIKASPLARKVAKAYNLDLGRITGTGPGGRILREDVEKARSEARVESAPASGEPLADHVTPFTGMRRAIARKMMAAKLETAQTYMSNTVDATRIGTFRKDLLPHIQETLGVRLTVTDIMMKITAAAIRQHPVINTRWTDEGVEHLADVHMGMAMALDAGLIVPVIRDILQKGLAQIARDRTELIEKGKENRLLPDDITGSTFTLSTLGMYGIEQFTANINVPESAILAVGAIVDKPVALNGDVVIRSMMNVTLSYDHRIIDGAEAAKFMRTLKNFMEHPMMLLV